MGNTKVQLDCTWLYVNPWLDVHTMSVNSTVVSVHLQVSVNYHWVYVNPKLSIHIVDAHSPWVSSSNYFP